MHYLVFLLFGLVGSPNFAPTHAEAFNESVEVMHAEDLSCGLNISRARIFDARCYTVDVGFKIGAGTTIVRDVMWDTSNGSSEVSQSTLGCCGRRIRIFSPIICNGNTRYVRAKGIALVDGCGWIPFDETIYIGEVCC